MEPSSFTAAPRCVRRAALDALRMSEPVAKAAQVRAL
ncbi:DUF455 domain-containing protein, partial [Burkholderia ambifaria]|nr:DUF455 domain-containing protein [Burkholderia ambifaria]